MEEYIQRLRRRPIRPDLGDIKNRKKEIFELSMKISNGISTNTWTMKHLEKALASLKNNKARDPTGYVNEIFKEDIIGTDLKRSLLSKMNKIKREKIISEFMKITNLTMVPKKRPLTELENERGIFRVDILEAFK